jgi:Zn-dependent protease
MKRFYRIDSTRVSYREYWWGTKSPLVLLAWLVRLFRVQIPSSTDDPNVETLEPFEVQEDGLPPEVREAFEPLQEELAHHGFHSPIYHAIRIEFLETSIYWATFCHRTGRAIARIHNRIWTQPTKPRNRLFPVFMTGFRDGGYQVFSAGKPDLLAPSGWDVHYRQGATATDLWQAHEMELEIHRDRPIMPVAYTEQVRAFLHVQHAALRDFHVARGVFVPMSEEVLEVEDASAEAAGAEAMPAENMEILAELKCLQTRQSSALGGLLMFVLSAGLFVAAGQANWSWKVVAILVPILFFHELGHLVTMRLFRYRNTRMFFIPLFGAAVTGRNFNVAGWKKAVVSLMGPVPGIFAGGALGIVGMLAGQKVLTEAALFALILNAFNLVPVLPLDGGWVWHATIFCRHRYLDLTFRVMAIFGLVGLGLLTSDHFLSYVAIPMIMGLPAAYRTAAIAELVRARGPVESSPDGQSIPLAVANEIVTEVKKRFPRALSARNAALVTLNVYETLNARPPSWPATLGLIGVQGISFVAAVIFGAILIAGGRPGGFIANARAVAERPKTPYTRGSILTWPAKEPDKASGGGRNTIVANFADRATAEATVRGLSARLPATARLTLFGQTIFLSLPEEDEKSRNHCFDELRRATRMIAVDHADHRIGCRLSCLAPKDERATEEMLAELQDYFGAVSQAPLIPPWSPLWRESPQVDRWRRARNTYQRLNRGPVDFYNSPEMQEVNEKLQRAVARGNKRDQEAAIAEQRRVMQTAFQKHVTALRAEGPDKVDVELIDAYVTWRKTSEARKQPPADLEDDEVAPIRLPDSVTKPMGLLPGHRQQPKAHRGPWAYGYANRSGMYVSLFLMSPDIDQDLPALAEWLYMKGCLRVSYDCKVGEVKEEAAEEDED